VPRLEPLGDGRRQDVQKQALGALLLALERGLRPVALDDEEA
jgi:hypothetical protein